MAKSKKTKFANIIIVICIIMCIVLTAAVLYEYHRLDTPITSSVLIPLCGIWSGELLIIMLRQVLGQDIVSQAKKPKNPENEQEFTSI